MNPVREQVGKFGDEYRQFVVNVENFIRTKMVGTVVRDLPTDEGYREVVVSRNGIDYHFVVYLGYVLLQGEKFVMDDEGQEAIIDRIAKATDR